LSFTARRIAADSSAVLWPTTGTAVAVALIGVSPGRILGLSIVARLVLSGPKGR
jgi:hypothetical protein